MPNAPYPKPLPACLTIRTADIADAKWLSLFAESTFRTTYGAMNTAEQMTAHCRSSFSERIQATEISNPDMVSLLCEEKGTLIGYAQLRWGESPDFISCRNPGEIQRLYVGDKWHGKGIAQALMDACINEMKKRQSDVVWLGVWEHNPRALAFYRKRGFVEVGEHVFPFGGDSQRDIVMARSVASLENL